MDELSQFKIETRYEHTHTHTQHTHTHTYMHTHTRTHMHSRMAKWPKISQTRQWINYVSTCLHHFKCCLIYCFSQEVEDLNMLTRNHSTPPPELDPIPISDIIGPLQFGVLMNDNAFGTYECAISTTSLCLCLVEARGYNNCSFFIMYVYALHYILKFGLAECMLALV